MQESLKPKFTDVKADSQLTPVQQLSLDVLLCCVEGGLRLLAPFMPYLSEELWQRIPRFPGGIPPSICVAAYPRHSDLSMFEDSNLEKDVTFMNHFIKTIRVARAAYELPNKVKTDCFVVSSEPSLDTVLKEESVTLCALSYSKSISVVDPAQVPVGCVTAVVSDKCTAYILLKGLIDLSKEEDRINKKVAFNQQQIGKLKEAMSKTDYEDKVPQEVREKNSEKLTSLEGEVDELAKALANVKIMLKEGQ